MATKERPILFSGPMVRAILDGSKTQTRRVVKPQPEWIRSDEFGVLFECPTTSGTYSPKRFAGLCPYGKPGDRLWTRSGWSVTYSESRHQSWWSGPEGTGISFVTHGRPERPKRLGNQPSIHMPRWVAQNLRLPVLEVTDVRVERVQDIPHYDIRKEGFDCPAHDFPGGMCVSECVALRNEFLSTWNRLNAKRGYGWDANPWVWVVSFRRVD